jgi:hypothetical protein
MNLGKLGLCTAGAIASVALVLAACSSSSTTTGTTDGGTTSSSSGSSGSSSCAPSPGTYTVTWTGDPSNSSTCPPGSELSGDENVNESEDTADAGPGCTVTADGCTFTEHCAETADGGVMNSSDTTFTTPSDGASSFSGSITSVTSGGGVDQTCKYTVSGTKK